MRACRAVLQSRNGVGLIARVSGQMVQNHPEGYGPTQEARFIEAIQNCDELGQFNCTSGQFSTIVPCPARLIIEEYLWSPTIFPRLRRTREFPLSFIPTFRDLSTQFFFGR
jgi:hypothetical protein